ncbi:MAG: GCN5-related N-acetyltransferase [Gemmatimonadetes bacterium]|jgi:GNAT superfamily N-acetyltransferase|nr:GCN5-related N-acetyltransferase [Gemmatimonadota bacterium]
MNPDTKIAPPAGLHIRRATLADAPLIASLGAETFVTSFGAQNTRENLAKHLANAFGEEIQRRELTDPSVTYLIAELDGRTAGYAQVREGEAPECITGAVPVEVRRFYVVHDFHGTGIAQALMEACAGEARKRGGRTLWLGVWDQNPRAIRFYTKCGFEDVGGQTFLLGDDPQQDRVLSRSLEARGT